MKRKIIAYNFVLTEVLEPLKDEYDVEFFEKINPKTDQAFINALQDAEGIIGLALPADAELLDRAPNLKIVSNNSTGYNNLSLDEMTKRGVMGTNTPGVLEGTTADAIFGILLAAARRIPEMDQFVKNGNWQHHLTTEQFAVDVHHKTLGIIGMGKIGSEIAKRGHCGFDMNILYHNRSRNIEAEEKYHAEYCDLDNLLKKSDFVLLMTPLTQETENLIGEREFKLMKNSAIFVNGSRGKTVDEAALIEALKNNEIYGAALDVYQIEPVKMNNPLLQFPNVVTTPHLGSATFETEEKMAKLAMENLLDGLNGKRPKNLVNPEVLDIL
ncbi:2-hydroxyacid dehydrogenase [Neobacillus kokaensis]|uniref:Bifunctional glyoxylate/hydroxypyruvate reductase B n=1 Tax=Neobacillus kokaensis TaxID=2759023 RepID=A0ABQ3N239_9BACI|nr:D-glycerate dehydrogenase [Neobacillus kokaensis]GHH99008.1 bifunctional glyoxylate/hydroxypyruvate reductase B [Neobacillus kokaensis]